MYHNIEQMWSLTFHTLYYMCSAQVQNHILWCMRKSYTLMYVRTHVVVLPFEQLFLCVLAYMHCDVSWGIGAQVIRVVDFAHFALNKFESLTISLWFNALPLIIFECPFHTSSTKPNPYTNFLHIAFSIATFISKVLEQRESLLTFMYHVKCNIFGLIGHIWPLKTIIEFLSLSHTVPFH